MIVCFRAFEDFRDAMYVPVIANVGHITYDLEIGAMVLYAERGEYYALMDLERWEMWFGSIAGHLVKDSESVVELNTVDVFFRKPEAMDEDELKEWKMTVKKKTLLLPLMMHSGN